MTDYTIINAPARIWLQIGDDFLPGDIDFETLSDVSWCQDSILDTDVEYVHASRYDALVSANEQQAAEIAALLVNLELATQELKNIANADTIAWDDPTQYEAWAKSRARFALGKIGEAT